MCSDSDLPGASSGEPAGADRAPTRSRRRATAHNDIRAIADDMALDPGMGNCGKAGQWVPVGVGLPTVLIGGLTVGGSAP